MNSEEWQDGYLSFYAGVLPNDCPYKKGTIQANEWMDGALYAWDEQLDYMIKEVEDERITQLEIIYDEQEESNA